MTKLIRATVALAAASALCALAACDRDANHTPSAQADPSAQTINVKPAPPTGDPPGTTAVTGNQSDLTQGQSQNQMPLEGQNHNYSSVAPQQSQKPGSGEAPSEGRNAKGDPEQQGGSQANGKGSSQ